METQQCGNCRFYAPRRTADTGSCRRRAPTGAHDGVAYGTAYQFPRTLPTEWCGEYEPAIPPAEATLRGASLSQLLRREYQPAPPPAEATTG